MKKIFLTVLIVVFVIGAYNFIKPLPTDVSFLGDTYVVPSSDIHFFEDVTFADDDGVRTSEQEIFDEIFRMIDASQEYVLIDFFFYSDFTGVETSSYRKLANELTQKLLQKKSENPNIIIQVIVDPINVMYGGHKSKDFELLRDSGISVLVTDLRPLRDSNPLYSGIWRTFFQWSGNSDSGGVLPNILDIKSPKLSARTYLSLLNYKANHRKVVLTDYSNETGIGFSTLITSANPHDGSSAHTNIAVRVDSSVWKDALTTEAAVAKFSGAPFVYPTNELLDKISNESEEGILVQFLTEGAIEDRILQEISVLSEGDELDMAMFYVSDRDVVRELKLADKRGVRMRLLFDPNKDAFGHEKNGVPNRQVAYELMKNTDGNTTIRWCNTHGEQCHSKLLFTKKGDKTVVLMGSANFTKRNIGDYNLETNMVFTGVEDIAFFSDVNTYFEGQWSNERGREYTVPYEVYEDTSLYRTIVYRLREFSGFSRW